VAVTKNIVHLEISAENDDISYK